MDDDDLDLDVPIPQPIFVSDYRHAHLDTYAPIGHLVYHLGPTAMTPTTPGHFTLSEAAYLYSCWLGMAGGRQTTKIENSWRENG